MRYASLVVVAAATLAGSSAHAQATYKRGIPDSLAKQSKIAETAAAATAQARFPKAKIEAVELEREDGKLLYSYELKTAGKTGVDEVNVDANTGKIIAVSHESPVTEKKEAAAEAKEAKKVAPKKP
jgi:uncharacterized membrane protein YkoI